MPLPLFLFLQSGPVFRFSSFLFLAASIFLFCSAALSTLLAIRVNLLTSDIHTMGDTY